MVWSSERVGDKGRLNFDSLSSSKGSPVLPNMFSLETVACACNCMLELALSICVDVLRNNFWRIIFMNMWTSVILRCS